MFLQPRDTKYLILDDGRKLCLECLDSAIMDTHECQPLYLEIREFYEGLHMKVEQQIPMLLVERSALNEAMEGEKHVIDLLCLLTINTLFYFNLLVISHFSCRDIITYLKPEDSVCLKNKPSQQ